MGGVQENRLYGALLQMTAVNKVLPPGEAKRHLENAINKFLEPPYGVARGGARASTRRPPANS